MITLNVNGLHKCIKRDKVTAKMKIEKLHMTFRQETHPGNRGLVIRNKASGTHKISMRNFLVVYETSFVLICAGDWNIHKQPKLDSTNTLKRVSPNAKIDV